MKFCINEKASNKVATWVMVVSWENCCWPLPSTYFKTCKECDLSILRDNLILVFCCPSLLHPWYSSWHDTLTSYKCANLWKFIPLSEFAKCRLRWRSMENCRVDFQLELSSGFTGSWAGSEIIEGLELSRFKTITAFGYIFLSSSNTWNLFMCYSIWS